MKHLIEGVAEFYPCKICREHFKRDVKLNPPKVENRKTLSLWVC